MGDMKIIARATKIKVCDSIDTIARVHEIEYRNSVAIVSIGDSANSKINARVRDIEDRDNVANVIVDKSYISPHQRTNVAIDINNESNFSSHQRANVATGPRANVVTIDKLTIDTRQQANVAIVKHNR